MARDYTREVPTIHDNSQGGEAHAFCSVECRAKHPLLMSEHDLSLGIDKFDDWAADTICETCDKVINPVKQTSRVGALSTGPFYITLNRSVRWFEVEQQLICFLSVKAGVDPDVVGRVSPTAVIVADYWKNVHGSLVGFEATLLEEANMYVIKVSPVTELSSRIEEAVKFGFAEMIGLRVRPLVGGS